MSLNDLYWLGFFVVMILFADIILGNLRAGVEGVNNSSAGIKGVMKKSMILVLVLFMTGLLFLANTFMETTAIIAMVTGSYSAIITTLGYYEIQSALANIQIAYPDMNIYEGLNKFFNVKSEKINKTRKLNALKSEIEE